MKKQGAEIKTFYRITKVPNGGNVKKAYEHSIKTAKTKTDLQKIEFNLRGDWKNKAYRSALNEQIAEQGYRVEYVAP